ncbi:hypothetical protein [Micromonospora sp. ATA51]|uniref:hypothetical protein n=1 Tax=Micromonospora sp. ATA51 TaxID=2806098 RepID=UPI001A3CC05E|nr:hypothetical protein [Micromonospora sp. ATA51]MBM0224710.1 hypothetical protein [Micromonospora sp. ATA51]
MIPPNRPRGHALRVLRLCSTFEMPSGRPDPRAARFDAIGGMQTHVHRKQPAQRGVLAGVEDGVLHAGGDEAVLFRVGHGVGAGHQPFLGGPHLGILAEGALLEQRPRQGRPDPRK